MRTILPLLPFLAAVLLYAEDTSQQLQIREMIQAVQSAPEGERYRKMNEFKQMIRSMNAQKRSEAIAQMQEAMASGDVAQKKEQTQTRTRKEEGDGEMIRTQSQKQIRDLQKQQSQQQMQQHSQMSNQQQINRALNPTAPGTAPQGPGGKYGNRL